MLDLSPPAGLCPMPKGWMVPYMFPDERVKVYEPLCIAVYHASAGRACCETFEQSRRTLATSSVLQCSALLRPSQSSNVNSHLYLACKQILVVSLACRDVRTS